MDKSYNKKVPKYRLGDLVEFITKYTGIKWLVKKVVGEDCGCDERKEFLNRITPNLSLDFFRKKKEEVKKILPKDLNTSGRIRSKLLHKENATIFIQMAAYRDPELRNTLEDLLSKATNPDRLHICIAWQHGTEDKWDTLEDYMEDDRFTILDLHYSESKGVCWARNKIQQHYRGEDYTLQLDSHHRFIEGWDVVLIEELEKLQKNGSEKPLLTGYIPSYDPKNDPEGRVNVPWYMHFDRFSPDGNVHFQPESIDDYKDQPGPVPARFYSAHFAFTVGIFAQEVQHDPELYFHGEEISISVRAYTHGYDLYHPNKVIIWHEYTRSGKRKHWDDDKEWPGLNTKAHARVRKLLGVDGEICTPCNRKSFGKYYLGDKRTIQEYEIYAGIRFKDRGAQQWTLDRKYAPNPIVDDFDNSFLHRFKHCIDVWKGDVPEDDYEFWAVAFHDAAGRDLYRRDADATEVKSFFNAAKNNDFLNVWREYAGPVPDHWSIWPYSTSKGWCRRLTGKLKEENA